MNYIKQLNTFRDWMVRNQCSASEKLLWYLLMSINNDYGWVEWFSLSNPFLAGMMSVSESTLKTARNELKQKKLIDFVQGKGRGHYVKYKMMKLYPDKVSNIDGLPDDLPSNLDKSSNIDGIPDGIPDGLPPETPVNTRVNLPPKPKPKLKLKPKEDITPLPPKINFAEFVSMTNVEYSTLVTEFGEEGAQRLIVILDNYKGASGKKYKSDYRAIRTWVIDRHNQAFLANMRCKIFAKNVKISTLSIYARNARRNIAKTQNM